MPAPVAEPAKATPKQTAVGLVAIAAIATGLWAVGKHGLTPTSTKTETVTRTAYQGQWPLTVDSVVLSCPNELVLFTAGGVVYYQFPTSGQHDLDEITADVPAPGLKTPPFELITEGQKLC